MVDQNTFTETIRAVQDIIRTSAEPMTREEILSYFKDMDLNKAQMERLQDTGRQHLGRILNRKQTRKKALFPSRPCSRCISMS